MVGLSPQDSVPGLQLNVDTKLSRRQMKWVTRNHLPHYAKCRVPFPKSSPMQSSSKIPVGHASCLMLPHPPIPYGILGCFNTSYPPTEGRKKKYLNLNCCIFDSNTAQTTLTTPNVTRVKPPNEPMLNFSSISTSPRASSFLACNSYCCLQKSYQKSWSWVISCCYSFLITLHLDYWNISLRYSRHSPARWSTQGLECFGQKHLIFQEMRDIIPFSVSCTALPIIPSFTADLLSSTHLTPTLADKKLWQFG